MAGDGSRGAVTTPARILWVEPHELARLGLVSALAEGAGVIDGAVLADFPVGAPPPAPSPVEIVVVPADSDPARVDRLRAATPGASLAALLRDTSPPMVEAACALGPGGFLLEGDLSLASILDAFSAMRCGLVPMPSGLTRALLQRRPRTGCGPTPPSAPARELTRREGAVAALLVEGLSNKQIARRLQISEHGAKRHVADLRLKLGAPNRTVAVAVLLHASGATG